jgi:hypothetical protein
VDSEIKRVAHRKREKKKAEYSGSRWAGLILLIITFIVSLFFYARSGAADFFSTLFSPAKYSIQK